MTLEELLTTLKRVEAIAHYYNNVAGQSDEIVGAFGGIVDEVGEAIVIAKALIAKEKGTTNETR